MTLSAYWSRQPNFGDCLTSVLFERLAGVQVEFAKAGSAQMFAVGSIAENIPEGFTGIVLGTGKMRRSTVLDLSSARVLALRGPLTAQGSGADCSLYGDLGLLCRLIAPPLDPQFRLGVLPHFKDPDLAVACARKGNRLIDVEAGVDVVIRQVSECEQIVTSSLHGMILADSLGLPVRWETHPAIHGGRFKFEDYGLSLGEHIEPGVWRTADQGLIGERVEQLRAALWEACR